MLILSNTSGVQTFTIIPRFEPTTNVEVVFTSEVENKETHSFIVDGSYQNGKLSIDNTFSPTLELNTFYSIKVNAIGGTLAWRGRAFVTDQTSLPKFTVNENKFTEYQNNDNEFIVV